MWIPDSFTIHFIPEGLFVGRVFGPAHSQISDLRLNWVGCITTAYFPFCYTLTSKKMHFMLSSPHLNFIMSAYLVSLKVESFSEQLFDLLLSAFVLTHFLFKVHVFWEVHTNWRNLYRPFDIYYIRVKSTMKISSLFVAFLENMNFIRAPRLLRTPE